MDVLDVMHSYFRGERLEAAWFIAPAGIAFLAVAYAAWRAESGPTFWGIAGPSLLFGGVLLATGLGVAGRTGGQVAELVAVWSADPAAMLAAELSRMEKVEVLFSRTIPTFGALVAVGLLLRFAVPWEWAVAAGPVLAAAGGAGLVIDGFASRRVEPYLAALRAAAESHGL